MGKVGEGVPGDETFPDLNGKERRSLHGGMCGERAAPSAGVAAGSECARCDRCRCGDGCYWKRQPEPAVAGVGECFGAAVVVWVRDPVRHLVRGEER